MSIFPLVNYYVTNVEVSKSSSFKSGMCLVRDVNGNAVVADRAAVFYDGVNEQLGRFLGFASGDHDVANNIILSDPVGSNYIDSNNNFVDRANSQFSSVRRSILDFADENVGRFYNIFDNSSNGKRGVGVYNLEGEIYITDQFSSVLASNLYVDSSSSIVFSPGDLLTFGAGVNAGKLVKVDTSGFGPSVLIVGAVVRYDAGSNLLYFRYHLDVYKSATSFVTSNLSMNLDAKDPVSYSGSGSTWFDTTANANNAVLSNGTYWDPNGFMVLDGTNDLLTVADSNSLDFDTGDFTVESFYKGIQGGLHAPMSKSNWAIFSFYGTYGYFSWNWTIPGNNNYDLFGQKVINLGQWYHICVTRISGIKYLYIDGILQSSIADPFSYTNTSSLNLAYWNSFVLTNSHIGVSRIYKGLGLSSDQVRQNYHNTVAKYIN
jgi:hypothetical protein